MIDTDTLGTMSPLESIMNFFEKVWLCEIRQRHHVKAGSDGRCYRCNRLVENTTEPPVTPSHDSR